MTAQQFLQLGEDPPGVRLELVDGEVAVSPSPIPRHSYALLRLSAILMAHVDEKKLGELYGDLDTIFGQFDVRRPDLLFLARKRLRLVGEKAVEGSPDLCVEVISPSSIGYDRKEKFALYRKHKVAHYWIVDPNEKTMEGFKLSGSAYRLVGSGKNSDILRLPPFPKLEIPLVRLWRPD